MSHTMYAVTLHNFHGGKIIYTGRSLVRALRAARKHDCTRSGQCVAGPTLRRISPDGRQAIAYDWHAARPFCPATEIGWGEETP